LVLGGAAVVVAVVVGAFVVTSDSSSGPSRDVVVTAEVGRQSLLE
jgi:hypothetical protein